MNLTVEVSPADVEAGSTITISVPADAQLRVQLLSNDVNSSYAQKNLTEKTIRNVPKGSYDLVVLDTSRKYCPEVKQVIVE